MHSIFVITVNRDQGESSRLLDYLTEHGSGGGVEVVHVFVGEFGTERELDSAVERMLREGAEG